MKRLFYRVCAVDEIRLSSKSELLLSRKHLVYKFAVEHGDFWLILS